MQIAFFESIMGLQSLQCSIKAFKNVAVKHKYFGINDCKLLTFCYPACIETHLPAFTDKEIYLK
jgi:hypothetical protein